MSLDLVTHSFYLCIKTLLRKYNPEQIFLRTYSGMGYPNREIQKVVEHEWGCEVFVNFLGLHGVSSDLPSYILDILAKNNDGGEGWSLFFDFFNNHILWLFFDIISQRKYSKISQKNFDDCISRILISLLGFGSRYDFAMTYLRFSPLMISNIRSKKQIQRILQEIFQLHHHLKIIENIPHKIPIAMNQRNALGRKNTQIGINFILGKTIVSYQTKIAILIEDIHYQQALDFFPHAEKYKMLKETLSFLTRHEFAIDLYLKIKFSKHMLFHLGKNSARLGWGCTLGKKETNSLVIFSLCD